MRNYYLFDCAKENFGRIATRMAFILQGKHKCSFEPRLDNGDFAVAINVSRMKYSGNKAELKKYHYFSGYPGGIRSEKLADLIKKQPQEVIRKAVYNMLPKNKLRDKMIKRLLMFENSEHGLKADFKKYNA